VRRHNTPFQQILRSSDELPWSISVSQISQRPCSIHCNICLPPDDVTANFRPSSKGALQQRPKHPSCSPFGSQIYNWLSQPCTQRPWNRTPPGREETCFEQQPPHFPKLSWTRLVRMHFYASSSSLPTHALPSTARNGLGSRLPFLAKTFHSSEGCEENLSLLS